MSEQASERGKERREGGLKNKRREKERRKKTAK